MRGVRRSGERIDCGEALTTGGEDEHMEYRSVEPLSRAVAIERIRGNDGPTRAAALVSLAFHESDWRWVQDQCLSLFSDGDPGVRATAALCLGHIARIHRRLDLDRVLPALHRLQDDPNAGWQVADVMDDIDTYLD
jgi:hypothetical protein